MTPHPAPPCIRRLLLALLSDAFEVFAGRAQVKGKTFERDRTWTTLWFFAPDRYGPDDPTSFATVCKVLGLSASAIRRRLRSGADISLKHLG